MANNYAPFTVSPMIPTASIPDSFYDELENHDIFIDAEDRYGENNELTYFYSEEGTDVDEFAYYLKKLLNTLDSKQYPYFIIEGCHYCSKMREGEFGGYAFFITRDKIQVINTGHWLNQRIDGFIAKQAPEVPTH